MKYLLSILTLFCGAVLTQAQTIKLKKQSFELHNVTGSIIKFEGNKVLKIERD